MNMKRISYYTKLLVGAVMMLSVVSCNDFINVQPSGQEDEEQQFSSIRGFRNAMYGVYGSMATSDLYGGNLGFGFVDQLGQIFGYDNSSETSYFVGQYDYMRSDVRSIVDAIWTKQYQAIAYVNNIIDQTENAKFEHAAELRDQIVAIRSQFEGTTSEDVIKRLKTGARKGSAHATRRRSRIRTTGSCL